ncbi:hypothetical protein OGAPHI_005567 [Ogataea philodendri]|uniref:Uncharacterized protein n=1 Tax=Ogataea philodendri TaxID=1378263 RepID=A0A9P8T236_9ASCO|nr:uncharacterized protein OGAPHI_005567 [Ogataea philodendri]KAH3662316.1 hypothetical protein OGAPHI_005567 [Ogataea philodendri]
MGETGYWGSVWSSSNCSALTGVFAWYSTAEAGSMVVSSFGGGLRASLFLDSLGSTSSDPAVDDPASCDRDEYELELLMDPPLAIFGGESSLSSSFKEEFRLCTEDLADRLGDELYGLRDRGSRWRSADSAVGACAAKFGDRNG